MAMPLTGGNAPSINIKEPVLPAAQLTDIGADAISWADGGDTVAWSVGSSIYRRPFSSIEFWKDDDQKESSNIECVLFRRMLFHKKIDSSNLYYTTVFF